MFARLALDPVMEPTDGALVSVPARDGYAGYPSLQPDGAHQALASRRAISDTPDALTAALPRHSPSRLGR